MKLIALLLPFLLAGTSAAAQNTPSSDYLVTTAGDTLRGRIQQLGRHHDRVVRLRRAGLAPVDFTAATAASYGSASGPLGVSLKVGPRGSAQFLAPLVRGYVSLYSGEDVQQERRFYLQPADSAYAVEVAPVTAQLTYARLLSGCPSLEFGSNEVQDRYRYTSTGLTKLVLAYNRCRQPQQPAQPVRQGNALHASLGLKAGLNTSSFSNFGPPADRYAGKQSGAGGYQGGVTLRLDTRTPFSVQLEAVYMALRSTYGPYELTGFNSGIPSNTQTARISYAQVQVPLLARYTAGLGTFRPFLTAGPSVALNVGNKSTFRSPSAGGQTVEAPLRIGQRALGLAGGGGVSVHRPGLPVFSVEARFDRMVDSISSAFIVPEPGHSTLRLDLGISF